MIKCKGCGGEFAKERFFWKPDGQLSRYMCKDCCRIEGQRRRRQYIAGGRCYCARQREDSDRNLCRRCRQLTRKYDGQRKASFAKLTPERRARLTKKWRLNGLYGVSIEWFDQQLLRQEGKCAICKNAPSGRGLANSTLHVDHDHKTKTVRGLLCSRCNMLLGMADEDMSLLMASVRYLGKHRAEELVDFMVGSG
jgi:hypothetical protein